MSVLRRLKTSFLWSGEDLYVNLKLTKRSRSCHQVVPQSWGLKSNSNPQSDFILTLKTRGAVPLLPHIETSWSTPHRFHGNQRARASAALQFESCTCRLAGWRVECDALLSHPPSLLSPLHRRRVALEPESEGVQAEREKEAALWVQTHLQFSTQLWIWGLFEFKAQKQN